MKRKNQKYLIRHTKKAKALHELRARNALGFTIIELMVVIAIIGVVLAVAIPSFAGIQQKMRLRAGAKETAQHFRHIRERALAKGRDYKITRLDAHHFQVTDPDGNVSTIKIGETTGGNLQFGTTAGVAVTPPEANMAGPDIDGFDFNNDKLIFQARGAASKGVMYINDGKENYAIGINPLGKTRIYVFASGAWQAL